MVVEAATIGKNMKGERFALRYVDGSEVALVVDRAEGLNAQANRLRAYAFDLARSARSRLLVLRSSHLTSRR